MGTSLKRLADVQLKSGARNHVTLLLVPVFSPGGLVWDQSTEETSVVMIDGETDGEKKGEGGKHRYFLYNSCKL